MNSSKLIQLLGTFSSAELREFNDFIASPYFNKNQELIRFYAYLKKIAPNFPPKKIERKFVFAKLYPQRGYDEKQLNYLMSFLLKLAEKFIGLKKYENIDHLTDYHVLLSYFDRDLNKHYNSLYEKINKKLDKSPVRNDDFYYLKYLLAEKAILLYIKQDERKYDQAFQQTVDYIDIHYLIKKLKYTCAIVNKSHIVSASYELKLVEEIKHYLAEHPHREIPAIHTHYQALMMMVAKNGDKHFEEVKKVLFQEEAIFAYTEQKDLFIVATNYCIRQFNLGNQKYLEELFNLYQQGIEKEWLFSNQEYLSLSIYKNIVKTGLLLNNFEWVESFIRKYNKKLPPDLRANSLHYNLAAFYHATKDLDSAQTHLSKVDYASDIYLNLASRKLLIKIYFEQKEIESLLSIIAALRQFLKRNNIVSDVLRKNYVNFIQALQFLIKGDIKSIQKCASLLDSTEGVADPQWLRQMLKEKTITK